MIAGQVGGMDALVDQALAARARGEHGAAMTFWRAALDAAPDDAGLALELMADMRVDWGYPDSDLRFRRAARSLPDEVWIGHYATFYTLHGAEAEWIGARAASLLARRPGDARLLALLGDVAAHGRRWGEALRWFEAAIAAGGEGSERWRHMARSARLYAALEAAGWREEGPGYTAVLLNLDRAADRAAETGRRYAGGGVVPRRQAAVEGLLLPGAAGALLAGVGAPKGTLGCFLSHVAAWEALLAGDAEALLVLEDDTVPQLSLPARLGSLGLPEGWELVFVNDRMAPTLPAATGWSVHRVAEVVRQFAPQTRAPGGDGYLVSRAGAARLLRLVGADGMANDLDWRLVRYAMTGDEVDAVPACLHAREALRVLPGAQGEALAAFVLHPPLIREVGLSSDRMLADAGRMGEGVE